MTTDTEFTSAQQKAAGLRALADMLEANPDVAELADTGHLYMFHTASAAQHALVARAALAHGFTVDKSVGERQYNLILRSGPVGAELSDMVAHSLSMAASYASFAKAVTS